MTIREKIRQYEEECLNIQKKLILMDNDLQFVKEGTEGRLIMDLAIEILVDKHECTVILKDLMETMIPLH